MKKKKQNPQWVVSIEGMHCASCEILVERRFLKIPGIEKVRVKQAEGKAYLKGSRMPDLSELQSSLEGSEYRILNTESAKPNTPQDYLQIGSLFLIFMLVYLIVSELKLLPELGVTENMSYGFVFAIGLVAAVSSCIAVVGGLLLAVAAKYNEKHPELSGIAKFKPHIYFNAGRVASYTLFGALIGWLGSAITISPRVNGVLVVLVSLVMILLGLQLLKLFPGLQKIQPKMPKFIAHKMHDWTGQDSKFGPVLLGGLTFFLPCGFTQALQLYVLSQSDPWVGALTMLVFSLGTLPALLSLSAVSSFAKGHFQKHFLRFAGVTVILLGIFNINNGLTLMGLPLDLASAVQSDPSETRELSVAEQEDGNQIVEMAVRGFDYYPNQFEVKVGVPVEWRIEGQNAAGCGQVLLMPEMDIFQYLDRNDTTIIRFTPTETGRFEFNCSMGMMTPNSYFNVTE